MSQYPTMPNFGVNAILTKEDSAHFKESKEDNTVGNKARRVTRSLGLAISKAASAV